ncbi:MAG: hypothetical protein ACJ8EL_03385 [Rhizomicrobium sp.]
MRNCFAVLSLALVALAACNKSSPPPQEPVKPRITAVADVKLHPRAP